MKDGEIRQLGNGWEIECEIRRLSWSDREDRWMGPLKPRRRSRHTFYRAYKDGREVDCVEGYRAAMNLVE